MKLGLQKLLKGREGRPRHCPYRPARDSVHMARPEAVSLCVCGSPEGLPSSAVECLGSWSLRALRSA